MPSPVDGKGALNIEHMFSFVLSYHHRAGGALQISQGDGRDPMLRNLTWLLLAAAVLLAHMTILMLIVR